MMTSAHVRVIEDQTDQGTQDLEDHEPESPAADDARPVRAGFHVRAVPIDEPLGE